MYRVVYRAPSIAVCMAHWYIKILPVREIYCIKYFVPHVIEGI